MAGAGYKLFQTGDVLTAAQVNTYLQEQTVMVFANSTARTTALSGVLAEGMVSYLEDTNAVEVYNGSAWVGVSGAGDVTEVQAGTGISVASGTGPIPVVTNTMATAIDAKADLIVGTGADTFARLAVGTDGHTLVADSSVSPTGLKWEAPASGGGMTLINTGGTALTGSSINISSIPSTYRDLYIVVVDFDPSVSGGPSIRIRLNSDNNLHFTATSASTINVGFTLTGITIAEDCNQTTPNGLATAYIYDYANAVTGKVIEVNSFCFNSTTATNANITTGVSAYSQTTAISSFDIFFTSGTMDGGTIYVYGVK